MAILYVAPMFARWEDMALMSPLGFEVSVKTPDNCPGCLLIFDSMEAMRETYPDVDESKVMLFRQPEETPESERETCPECGHEVEATGGPRGDGNYLICPSCGWDSSPGDDGWP